MIKWKEIQGTKGYYSISELGGIKSNTRTIITGITSFKSSVKHLKPYKTKKGYLSVDLKIDGERMIKPVHRLVAEAFIPNPENKKQVNHIDLDKTNNTVDNLEWCTQLENMKHAKDLGVFKKTQEHKDNHSKIMSKTVSQYDKNNNLINKFNSMKEASEITGISHGNICACAKGKRKTAGGFVWL